MNNNFSENIDDIDLICLDCKSDIEFTIDKEKMEIKYKCSNCESNQKEPIPLELYFQKVKEISKEINKCSECNNKGLPEKELFICFNCRNVVCIKCKEKHFQNDKCFNDEFLIKMEEKKSKCLYHNISYKYYCFDCKKNICEKCELKCLKKHHKFDTIETLDNKLDEFFSVIKKAEKEKNEIIKNKENSINELNDKMIEDIKKKKEDYENKLKENISKRNKAVSEIEKEKKNYNDIIENKKKELKKLMDSINDAYLEINNLFEKNKKVNEDCEKANCICLEQFNKAENESKEKNLNEVQKIKDEYDLKIKNENILIESYKIIEKLNRKNKTNIFYIKSISNILNEQNKDNILNEQNKDTFKKIKDIVEDTSSYNCFDNNNFIVFPTINNKIMIVYVYDENKIMYKNDDNNNLLIEYKEKIILLKHCYDTNSKKDYLLVTSENYTLRILSWDGQKWKIEYELKTKYYITCACFFEWNNGLYIITGDSEQNQVKIYILKNNQTFEISIDNINPKVYCINYYIDEKKNVYIVMGHDDICRSYILDNLKLKLYKEYYNDDKSSSYVSNIIIKEEKEIVKLIVCTPGLERIRIFNFHQEEGGSEIRRIKIGEDDNNLLVPLCMCLWNERTLIVGCNNNEIRKLDLLETKTTEKLDHHTTPVISLQKITLENKDILFSQGENEKITQWESVTF